MSRWLNRAFAALAIILFFAAGWVSPRALGLIGASCLCCAIIIIRDLDRQE